MSVDSKILLEIDFLVITTSYLSNLDFPGHILKISQNRSPAFKLENSPNKKTGPVNAGQEFLFLPERVHFFNYSFLVTYRQKNWVGRSGKNKKSAKIKKILRGNF